VNGASRQSSDLLLHNPREKGPVQKREASIGFSMNSATAIAGII
jgi:hypothetical protein